MAETLPLLQSSETETGLDMRPALVHAVGIAQSTGQTTGARNAQLNELLASPDLVEVRDELGFAFDADRGVFERHLQHARGLREEWTITDPFQMLDQIAAASAKRTVAPLSGFFAAQHVKYDVRNDAHLDANAFLAEHGVTASQSWGVRSFERTTSEIADARQAVVAFSGYAAEEVPVLSLKGSSAIVLSDPEGRTVYKVYTGMDEEAPEDARYEASRLHQLESTGITPHLLGTNLDTHPTDLPVIAMEMVPGVDSAYVSPEERQLAAAQITPILQQNGLYFGDAEVLWDAAQQRACIIDVTGLQEYYQGELNAQELDEIATSVRRGLHAKEA